MRSALILLSLALVLVACTSNDIIAPSPGSIRGVVKGPLTQRPLANVQMTTVPGTSVLLTNDSGAFTFPYVAAGEYIVKAVYRDTAFSAYASVPVRVLEGSTTTVDLILTLGSPTTGIITGRVTDESGKAVQGASVTIDKPFTSVETSADGSFMFLDVAPGTVNLNAVKDGLYGSATATVQKDAITKVNLTIYDQDPTRGLVTGIVVADKQPLPSASVSIPSIAKSTVTDANGSYTIKNIPSGVYEMVIAKEGLRTRYYEITVTAGAPTVKNADMSGSLPPFSTEGLELYLPLTGNIDDMSPKQRQMKAHNGDAKFVKDRFGESNTAIEFSGSNSLATRDGALMNYKELTIGAWVFIPSNSPPIQLILGKTLHPLGDGYYMTIDNGLLCFLYAVHGFAKYTRLDISNYPKDEWIWIGYSLDGNGNGWATVNGTTVNVKTTSNYSTITTSAQQFQIGDLETSTTASGFTGKMDHVVVYSRYMTVNDLKFIMEQRD